MSNTLVIQVGSFKVFGSNEETVMVTAYDNRIETSFDFLTVEEAISSMPTENNLIMRAIDHMDSDHIDYIMKQGDRLEYTNLSGCIVRGYHEMIASLSGKDEQ